MEIVKNMALDIFTWILSNILLMIGMFIYIYNIPVIIGYGLFFMVGMKIEIKGIKGELSKYEKIVLLIIGSFFSTCVYLAGAYIKIRY